YLRPPSTPPFPYTTLFRSIEWIAYRDPKAGRFRYAAVRDGRLEGCVFIAPDHKLVSRSWLSGLFAEQALSPNARMSLLTGQPLRSEEHTSELQSRFDLVCR